MVFIEKPVAATEKKRSEERSLFQLRKDVLSVERSSYKPAQYEINASVYNLLGAWSELDIKGEIREVGENEDNENPQERRQLIFQNIAQTHSTFFIAAGSW